MKIQHILFAALIFMQVSCNQVEFDPINPNDHLGVKIDSTYSISRLIKEYNTVTGLFGAVKIDTTIDVVINGIITSTDNDGNVYKYLTIQEEMPGGQAIKISVDVSGLSGIYPLGQRVAIKCNGLYIGKYAQSVQLGVYYENTEKGRIEPGRMPKPVSDLHIIPYGMPDAAAIIPDTLNIAQIRAGGDKLINKIVCIRNAYFTGKGADYGAPKVITDAEMIFAPSTNGFGYPQSREIQDGTGSVFISTSEYAKFASKPLPLSVYRGNITAIIGYYNDKDAVPSVSKIYHQLTIRSLNDLGKGFEGYLESIK
jgi:hypothetical protein